MSTNILTPHSARVGIDGSEIVIIIDEKKFLKLPKGSARHLARMVNENCDLLETGRIHKPLQRM